MAPSASVPYTYITTHPHPNPVLMFWTRRDVFTLTGLILLSSTFSQLGYWDTGRTSHHHHVHITTTTTTSAVAGMLDTYCIINHSHLINPEGKSPPAPSRERGRFICSCMAVWWVWLELQQTAVQSSNLFVLLVIDWGQGHAGHSYTVYRHTVTVSHPSMVWLHKPQGLGVLCPT